MKVTIDEETCVECGLCADTCPEVFEMADDKVRVKMQEVPDEFADACKEAIESCPVEAIQSED